MGHLKRYEEHYLTAVCGFFVIASWFGWFKELVEFDVAIIAAVLGGYPIIKNAMIAFIKGRDMKVGFLVSIALIASLAIGEYFAAGEVVFIMMLGELLENWTVAKSRNAVAKLRKLVPDTAMVKVKDEYINKPLSEIAIGDIVFVRPGESIPADGIVVNGSSSVDQSSITGESVPAEKGVGDEVYTSTMNQNGSLEIKVSKASEDTLISKIIHLVQQAETTKSPIVRITDKWANWLVPSSLTFAALTYFVTGDIIRAVTILIVFCPCALVLATPTAIVAAIGNAARQGVLIKDADVFEKVNKINIIAFDKTGTITKGELQVEKIFALGTHTDDEVLQLAASLEVHSSHPVSDAIVKRAQTGEISLLEVNEFSYHRGLGVEGRINKDMVHVGNLNFIRQASDNNSFDLPELEAANNSYVYFKGEIIGIIQVSDAVRENAGSIVKELYQYVEHILLLTGDNKDTAASIASKVHIEDYYYELLPDQKLDKVNGLKQNGDKVLMVGDGINDAPALVSADVGVAMGQKGIDAAIEAANVALLKDDLSKLPFVFALSRKTVRTININLMLSTIINLTAVLLAAWGLLGPVAGALVHNAGSVFVVGNSARLVLFKDKA
ncbi:MAG TPA: cation-translocating P-type ATPase [Clostridia bacterium]|nr:cation-translocating P-type ATPase [Clostridia bacterium]